MNAAERGLICFVSIVFIAVLNSNSTGKCAIHCWQNLRVRGLFEYDEDYVTLAQLYQWLKATFGEVEDYVEIYYLPDLGRWKDKINLLTDAQLRSYLRTVSQDLSLKSYIVVSTQSESPDQSPSNDSNSTVSTLTSQSKGSVERNFRQRVLTRDNGRCVFCGDAKKANLKAAHIFDIFRANDIPADDINFLHQYEIIDLYDTENGITLCSD